MLDNHLENELEGKSERGTNIRLYGCPAIPTNQRGAFPWSPAVVQCSGSFQQHLYHTVIAHKGPKPSLDAIPLTLLKEH